MMPPGRVQQLFAADDGNLWKKSFQQLDELVAQGRQDGADGLGNDDLSNIVVKGLKTRAASRAYLGVNGHQAAAGYLPETYAPELIPSASAPTIVKVAAAGKDDHAHDEAAAHHRRAADCDVHACTQRSARQGWVAVVGFMAGVAHADHSHDGSAARPAPAQWPYPAGWCPRP